MCESMYLNFNTFFYISFYFHDYKKIIYVTSGMGKEKLMA